MTLSISTHWKVLSRPNLDWLKCLSPKIFCAILMAAQASEGTALAQDLSEYGGSFSLGGRIEVTTDSRERGISNTANQPGARLVGEMLHSSGVFAEIELTGVDIDQYPSGQGLRAQLNGGYRFGSPEGWLFELGAQHSQFPGASQSGGQGYTLVTDEMSGDLIDAKLIPASVSFNTTEVFAGIHNGPFSVKYFYTLSPAFFGISGTIVCPALPDLQDSISCFQRDAQHSRGSDYVELEYAPRLSKSTTMIFRLGYQRVRNWEDFNTRNFAVELRQKWRSLDLALALTGARSQRSGAYDIKRSDNRIIDPTKTTLVFTAGYAF